MMQNIIRRKRRQYQGFTLLEIMLVVIIIGILAAAVVVNFSGLSEEARITAAQADSAKIRMQLGMFEQRYGHYPTAAEGGLYALLERPSTIPQDNWRRHLDTEPIDPWGNDYIYLIGAARVDATREYNLYSMGPNERDDSMQEDDVTGQPTRSRPGR